MFCVNFHNSSVWMLRLHLLRYNYYWLSLSYIQRLFSVKTLAIPVFRPISGNGSRHTAPVCAKSVNNNTPDATHLFNCSSLRKKKRCLLISHAVICLFEFWLQGEKKTEQREQQERGKEKRRKGKKKMSTAVLEQGLCPADACFTGFSLTIAKTCAPE